MVDELQEAINTAAALVAEIGTRFQRGDAAGQCVARLGAALTVIASLAAQRAGLPPDVRDQLAALLSRLGEATAAGDDWLARTGPELAIQNARDRLRRAYGFT